MPETIEIEGNIATIKNVSVVRRVPLDELLKGIERVPPVTFPTIARSQVFGHWREQPDNGITTAGILCEMPPAVRSITKENRHRIPFGLRRYRLSIPWTYFWFTATTHDVDASTTRRWSISEGRVYFAQQRYEDVNSPMIPAMLPNVDSAGGICWGSTAVPAHQTLADQIDGRVNNWYLTTFNDDLDGGHSYPYGEPNFRRWVQESRENVRSWEAWPEFADVNRRWTVAKLLTEEAIVPIATRFEGLAFIPEIQMPATFGRWDEWWATIPQTERARALRSAENVQADIGTTFEAATPIIEENETDNDDGGVAV